MDVTVVRAQGPVDIASAPALRARLDAALAGRRPVVVLDLEGVSRMDAAGVRVVAEAHRVAARQHTTMRVHRPAANVARVLQLAGALDQPRLAAGIGTREDGRPCAPGLVSSSSVPASPVWTAPAS